MHRLKGEHRGRDAGYPTPPAQIPACGFPAPGSSAILASAFLGYSLQGGSHCGLRSFTFGLCFLCRLRMAVRPFPL
jgi:hypothetical protein